MKKLIFLSLLVLFSCSKGEEEVVEEVYDDRPLIQRLAWSAYGKRGQAQQDGSYTLQGFQITEEGFSPRVRVPIKPQTSEYTTISGIELITSCGENISAVLKSNLRDFNISAYEVITNERNEYSSKWNIPEIDVSTGELAFNWAYKLVIQSIGENDERLRVFIEVITPDLCSAVDGGGNCQSYINLSEQLDWMGDLLSHKAPRCPNG